MHMAYSTIYCRGAIALGPLPCDDLGLHSRYEAACTDLVRKGNMPELPSRCHRPMRQALQCAFMLPLVSHARPGPRMHTVHCRVQDMCHGPGSLWQPYDA